MVGSLLVAEFQWKPDALLATRYFVVRAGVNAGKPSCAAEDEKKSMDPIFGSLWTLHSYKKRALWRLFHSLFSNHGQHASRGEK